MKKEEKISIETMTGVGKKKKLAGREYYILLSSGGKNG